MANWLKYVKGISPNPKGKRGLTAKDKEEIRKGKKRDVDHIKPVALHKKQPVLDLSNHWRIDTNTTSGRPPKHSYDWKNNLQVLPEKPHNKKTKSDIKKIRTKRNKDIEEGFIGKVDFGI